MAVRCCHKVLKKISVGFRVLIKRVIRVLKYVTRPSPIKTYYEFHISIYFRCCAGFDLLFPRCFIDKAIIIHFIIHNNVHLSIQTEL